MTLFVRRFAVLVLILALVAIPVAIVQYATAPSTAGMLADLQRLLELRRVIPKNSAPFCAR